LGLEDSSETASEKNQQPHKIFLGELGAPFAASRNL
jgi:hypothetical protein